MPEGLCIAGFTAGGGGDIGFAAAGAGCAGAVAGASAGAAAAILRLSAMKSFFFFPAWCIFPPSALIVKLPQRSLAPSSKVIAG
jgi:hypothetical protein